MENMASGRLSPGVLWLEPREEYWIVDPEDRQELLALRQTHGGLHSYKKIAETNASRMVSNVTDGGGEDVLPPVVMDDVAVMRITPLNSVKGSGAGAGAPRRGGGGGGVLDVLQPLELGSLDDSEGYEPQDGENEDEWQRFEQEQDNCTPRVLRRGSSNLSQSLQKVGAVASLFVRPSAWRAKAESIRRQRFARKRAEHRVRARALRDQYLAELHRMYAVEQQGPNNSPESLVTNDSEQASPPDGDPWAWAHEPGARARRTGVTRLDLGDIRRNLSAEFDVASVSDEDGSIIFLMDRGVSPILTQAAKSCRFSSLVWYSSDSTPSSVEDCFPEDFQFCECVPQGRRVLRPRVLAMMHVFDQECLCCVCNMPLPFLADEL